MNNKSLPFIKHELIRMLPAFIILAVGLFWFRAVIYLDIGSNSAQLIRNVKTLISPELTRPLYYIYMISAIIACMMVYNEERIRKHIKNTAVLPYKSSRRFWLRAMVFAIGTIIIFILFSIYMLIVLLSEKAGVGSLFILLSVLARDILWCLLFFAVFSFIQGFSGNIFAAGIFGFVIAFTYQLILDFTNGAYYHFTIEAAKIYGNINNIIDMTSAPIWIAALKLIPLSVIFLMFSLSLYRKYPNERAGRIFVYETPRYFFVICLSVVLYLVLMALSYELPILGRIEGNTILMIIYNLITFALAVYVISGISQIGSAHPFLHTKRKLAVMIIIVLCLTVLFTSIQEFFMRDPGEAHIKRVLKTRSYLDYPTPNDLALHLLDSDFTIDSVNTDGNLTVLLRYETYPGYTKELRKFNYPSIMFTRAVLILSRFPELDSVRFAEYDQEYEHERAGMTYNRSEIEAFFKMTVTDMVRSYPRYDDWNIPAGDYWGYIISINTKSSQN